MALKRLLKWGLLLAVSLTFGTVGAYEPPYYLNGDTNLPMIQNTGGLYNDGDTGLFMNVSTIEIEDDFEDGLQAGAMVEDRAGIEPIGEERIHVRLGVNEKAWALGKDGRWWEISENGEDPASLAVYFIRREMRKDERREALSGEINRILEIKGEAPGFVTPEKRVPLKESGAASEGEAVKEKGFVQKVGEASEESELENLPPLQVDIT